MRAEDAVRCLAEERVRDVSMRVQSITSDILDAIDDSRYAKRQHHIEEFAHRAVALVSDAMERLEEEESADSVRDAEELLASADVFLEALQDLLVSQEGGDLADQIGEVREKITLADALLRVTRGEY